MEKESHAFGRGFFCALICAFVEIRRRKVVSHSAHSLAQFRLKTENAIYFDSATQPTILVTAQKTCGGVIITVS
jgi:hypothetical protein